MPGKVRVKILAARNLPIMDRASEACDAFCELKLGNTSFKTDICRKSLNPQWNTDWFRFEVDDEELQDEPLQIRIMDYDTYSANDAIGKVYIDLNPLLGKEVGNSLSGWFPIYDTMHGVRGEVNLIVKVDLFSDSNRYRESSCGVRFFYGHGIPHGYYAEAILGFVEELVVNDDPEYKWIDKIRTPRASNEARQTLFSKLSGEVKRRIGHKALELGGNAVLGYNQCFDLEGESGIVVRGIGTAVTLVRIDMLQNTSPLHDSLKESPEECPSPPGPHSPTGTGQQILVGRLSQSPVRTSGIPCVPGPQQQQQPSQRRLSDPDTGTPPKGGSAGGSSSGSGTRLFINRPALARESLEMLEYPFITMKQFPLGFIQCIGGIVSARSVKLLDQINNPDDPETRDAWWTELRKEIRSHTRSLGCNVVLGYTETTSICEEVVILSASGTAVLLNQSAEKDSVKVAHTPSARHSVVPAVNNTDRTDGDHAKDKEKPLKIDVNLANSMKHVGDWSDEPVGASDCKLCHIPYSESSVPFRAHLVRCAVCKRSKVPDVLFMTIEPPPHILVTGKSSLIQARVCRMKKDLKGEQNAREISDSLPFLEYELHKQLISKLKLKNMNGIFGLKVQVSVGEKLIAGIATGTGAFLTALPSPSVPKFVAGHKDPIAETNGKVDDSDTSEDESREIDLLTGKKDACILQVGKVDDLEDIDVITLLIDPRTPEGFDLCNTEVLPGVESFAFNLQLFMQTYRAKLFCGGHPSRVLAQHFDHIIQSLFVKLRKLVPCCLASLTFQIDLPEQDELQVAVVGTAVGLEDNLPSSGYESKTKQAGQPLNTSADNEHELIFKMDEEKLSEPAPSHSPRPQTVQRSVACKYRDLYKEHYGIDMTPLNYIPGGQIKKYLGNLDFFFIREGTSIREEGGLNGFVQGFMTEILAIVRAHVASLGGNAVVAFQMAQFVLLHNLHKNQGQCLINVAGDAVLVQYVSHADGDANTSTGSGGS